MNVFFNPSDEMIFESSLDNLMQEIGRNQFMNVGPRKMIGEWLNKMSAMHGQIVFNDCLTHDDIAYDSKGVPQCPGVERFN